jgi:hypothetical protein
MEGGMRGREKEKGVGREQGVVYAKKKLRCTDTGEGRGAQTWIR